MRRILLALILMTLFVVHPVLAQNEISIDEMSVKIWPEYDQPSVLVIIDLFLSSDTSLPARVNLNIPAAAGTPNSVAVRELDGMLYLLDYDTRENGDWTELSFTTPYTEIWIEYYDPSIQINRDTRSYEYEWQGEYTVNNFNLEVQKPLTASNIVFQQSMGQPISGADGMTYYSTNVGEISAGTPLSLQFSYTKTDDTLSSSPISSVQPSEPVGNQTTGRLSFRQILPWLVAGLGLILIALGVFWYWQSTRAVQPAARRRHDAPEAVRKQTRKSENGDVYCHQCGKRANPGDLFCRACGTKLKLED